MSKIKEQDILKLLRGKASPKKLKALEEWSSKDTVNAVSLERYQRIYDEADHLSTYNHVDTDLEWKNFTSNIKESVADTEILEYFDGLASPTQRKKVEDWKKMSASNESDFETFNLILEESRELSDYKKVDVDNEWANFGKLLKEKETQPTESLEIQSSNVQKEISVAPTFKNTSTSTVHEAKEIPLITPYTEERQSNRVVMWRVFAVAASILLLAVFGWTLWQNAGSSTTSDDMFLTYATADYPEVITLSDGTIINLDEQTILTYFKDANLSEERSVTIDGKGEFNVASNPEKPFIVKAKRSGVGIRVLGTKFRLEKSDEYIEVIRNIEGSVRAYSLSDTSTHVVMTAGDRYAFDGAKFIELRDLEEEYNGKEYDILYVLDYLMEESGWRVTSSPYAEFNGEAIIMVDLDKPYEEILEDLARRQDFQYVKMPCDGCFQVTRFTVDY